MSEAGRYLLQSVTLVFSFEYWSHAGQRVGLEPNIMHVGLHYRNSLKTINDIKLYTNVHTYVIGKRVLINRTQYRDMANI